MMVVVARMSTSMMNNLAAQEVVDEVVDTLQNWTATLPFMDVEGIGTNGQPVDLFSYTSSHKKLPEGIGGPPPEVIFDRNKYRPPTEQGLRELAVLLLQRVAAIHGTYLGTPSRACRLACQRCRPYRDPRKNKLPPPPSASQQRSMDGDQQQDEFDEFGVKQDLRRHMFHRNKSFARLDGKKLKKNTATSLPVTHAEACKLALNLKMDKTKGYIYLNQGYGCSEHQGHPKPTAGGRALHKRHMSSGGRKLTEDGGRASAGGGLVFDV
jgi:hypothetical protein